MSSTQLYSLFFTAAAGQLASSVDGSAWTKGLVEGVGAIAR